MVRYGKSYPNSSKLSVQEMERLKERIRQRVHELRTYVPKIGVFGVTGVGKSSLCNALFGSDVAVISDVAACMGYDKRDCGRCLRGC
jgi:uncharacterized protein ykfA